ncbi:unnamed protein product [Ostreobium quekettii]|uniref:DDB1- and CUL4-associated factor 15 WD40 repeat-containing domain-containing protein n=1 Tax=Ostreobium quekettii TaxID=121088 RepID=A0A8S1IUB4_9CHLO|nr:unnamed protein product [Ostreobium quekettii]
MRRAPPTSALEMLFRRELGEETKGWKWRFKTRLMESVEDVMDSEGLMRGCVLLGFSDNGEYLISYSHSPLVESEWQEGYHMQLWRFNPCQRAKLRREFPLFLSRAARWQPSGFEHLACESGQLLITVHETMDSKFWIVHGQAPCCGDDGQEVESFVTVIPRNPSGPMRVEVLHFRYFCLPSNSSRSFFVVPPSTLVVDMGTGLQALCLNAHSMQNSADCCKPAAIPDSVEPQGDFPDSSVMVRFADTSWNGEAATSDGGLLSAEVEPLGPLFDYETFIGKLIEWSKAKGMLKDNARLSDYCVKILQHGPTGTLLVGNSNDVILLAGMLLKMSDSMPVYQAWIALVHLDLLTSKVLMTKSWRVLADSLLVTPGSAVLENMVTTAASVWEARICQLCAEGFQTHMLSNMSVLLTEESLPVLKHHQLPWVILGYKKHQQ